MSPTVGPFGRKVSSGLGVDIGTSSIKIAELTNVKGSIELVNMAIADTPDNGVKEGAVIDVPAVAETVRRLWKENGFKNKEVSCGIAGQDVIVRPVIFPRMPYEELKEAVKWEADKYLPFPVEDAMIDVVLPDPVVLLQETVTEVEVMLVAALRSKVESYATALELAGLTPIAIDIQPFCMMRAYGLKGDDESGSIAYIDIGGGTTDLVVCNGERLRMTRIVQVGGNHFTDAIVKATGLSEKEANDLKLLEAEVVPTEEDYENEKDPVRRKLLEAVYDVAHGLCLECKRSITYHDAQLQSKLESLSVREIVLAGGGSKLKGFAEMMGILTGLPVSYGNPYKRVTVSPSLVSSIDTEGMAPVMSVAVGLALREVEEE